MPGRTSPPQTGHCAGPTARIFSALRLPRLHDVAQPARCGANLDHLPGRGSIKMPNSMFARSMFAPVICAVWTLPRSHAVLCRPRAKERGRHGGDDDGANAVVGLGMAALAWGVLVATLRGRQGQRAHGALPRSCSSPRCFRRSITLNWSLTASGNRSAPSCSPSPSPSSRWH